MRYADAGVNISVADEAKRRIAAMAGKTFRRGVLAPIGGFGSLFQLDRKRWREPCWWRAAMAWDEAESGLSRREFIPASAPTS